MSVSASFLSRFVQYSAQLVTVSRPATLVSLILLLSATWSPLAAAAVCPGGVSEQTTASTHTLICSNLGGSIASSVTITAGMAGIYELTDLNNATAQDENGMDVFVNDGVIHDTCYQFTSTEAGTSGAIYSATVMNFTGFVGLTEGACSGGSPDPVAPPAPVVDTGTLTPESTYVFAGDYDIEGAIISVVVDNAPFNEFDPNDTLATGPVVVSSGRWATAAVTVPATTSYYVIANDPDSGLASLPTRHTVVVPITDTTPPTATLSLNGSPAANVTTVSYSLSFSEPVTGVDVNDVNPGLSGVTANVALTAQSGQNYTLTLSDISGSGTVQPQLIASNSGIEDAAGNPLQADAVGTVHNADVPLPDTTPPTATLSLNGSPAANVTTISYSLSFSEPVTGVDVNDFELVKSGTAGSLSFATTNAQNYTLTVSGISGNGELQLVLNASNSGIKNSADILLEENAYGAVHKVDMEAPSVQSIRFDTQPAAGATTVFYSVVFSEPVNDVSNAGFKLLSVPDAAVSGMINVEPQSITSIGSNYVVKVSGLSGEGNFTLQLIASSSGITDYASNSLVGDAAGPMSNFPFKTTQSITFANPGQMNFSFVTTTLTASASSGLPVRFSSGSPAVCTVTESGVLTHIKPGSCTIHADQAGNTTYSAAARQSQLFSIVATVPSQPEITEVVAGNASVTIKASALNGGADITRYQVTATGETTPKVWTVNTLPAELTGLTNGTAYTFTLTATNAQGTSIPSSPFGPVTPVAPNSAPVVQDLSQTIKEDTVARLQLSATDADGDAISFHLVNGEKTSHGNAQISGSELLYTPDQNFIGTDTFKIYAFDSKAQSAYATVTITVTAANDAPSLIAPIPAITKSENDGAFTVDFSPYFTDEDGDVLELSFSDHINDLGLTYYTEGLKAFLELDGVSSGSQSITVTVTDPSGASASGNFQFTIAAVNDPIYIVADTAIQWTASSGEQGLFNLTDYVEDEESSFANGSLVATVRLSDSAQSVIHAKVEGSALTLTALKAGQGTAVLIVKDDYGSDSSNQVEITLSFDVQFVNSAPVLINVTQCSETKVGYLNKPFQLNLNDCVEDPDGQTLSYTAPSADPGKYTTTIANSSLTVLPSETGVYTVNLTAEDTEGAAVSFTLTLRVVSGDIEPVTLNVPQNVSIEIKGEYTDISLKTLLGLPETATKAEVTEAQHALTGGCCLAVPEGLDPRGILKWNHQNNSLIWRATNSVGESLIETQRPTVIPLVQASKSSYVAPIDRHLVKVSVSTLVWGDHISNEFDGVRDLTFVENPEVSNCPQDQGYSLETREDTGSQFFTSHSFTYVMDNTSVGCRDFLIARKTNSVFSIDSNRSAVVVTWDYRNDSPRTEPIVVDVYPNRTVATSSTITINNPNRNNTFPGLTGSDTSFIVPVAQEFVHPPTPPSPPPLSAVNGPALSALLPGEGGIISGQSAQMSAMAATPLNTLSDGTEYPITIIESDNENWTLVLPDNLANGLYKVQLNLIDAVGTPAQSTFYLNKVDTLPVLSAQVDSDGDGLSDAEEGYADKNGNGVADFADNSSQPSYLPFSLFVEQPVYVQCDVGYRCALGQFALQSAGGGAFITPAELATIAGLMPDEGYNPIAGATDFIVRNIGTVGNAVLVVLPQLNPIPQMTQLRIYKDGQWADFSEDTNNTIWSAPGSATHCPLPGSDEYTTGLTAGHYCVQVLLQDGGSNDADGLANGEVVLTSAVTLQGNHLPVATADTLQVPFAGSGVINLLANDTDADGDALTLIGVTAPFGEVSFNANGELSYSAALNYVGTVQLGYVLEDSAGARSDGAVSVTVKPNREPLPKADAIVVFNRSSMMIDVLSNDSDPDGHALKLVAVQAQHGKVNVSYNKVWYVPAADYVGSDTLTYTLADEWGLEAIGTANLTVLAGASAEDKSSSGALSVWYLLFSLFLVLWRWQAVLTERRQDQLL